MGGLVVVSKIGIVEHRQHRGPVADAQRDRQAPADAGDLVARAPDVERRRELAARGGEMIRQRIGILEPALLHQVGDGVHHVVDIVPVVVDAHVLLVQVALIGRGGGGKPVVGAGVVADPVINVAGHVHHVAAVGRETGQQRGALDRALRVIARLHRVNPVVIRGRVIGSVFEHGFEDRDLLFHAGVGVALIVETIAERIREEDACLNIARFFLDQLAIEGDRRPLLAGVRVRFGRGCLDIQPVGPAGFALQLHGLIEGLWCVNLVLFTAELERLRKPPVTHGALRVGADGLLKSLRRLVVPEVVEQSEALVEPGLRFGRGSDGDMRIADAGHAHRDRQLFGRRKCVHSTHGRHGCSSIHATCLRTCAHGSSQERTGDRHPNGCFHHADEFTLSTQSCASRNATRRAK